MYSIQSQWFCLIKKWLRAQILLYTDGGGDVAGCAEGDEDEDKDEDQDEDEDEDEDGDEDADEDEDGDDNEDGDEVEDGGGLKTGTRAGWDTQMCVLNFGMGMGTPRPKNHPRETGNCNLARPPRGVCEMGISGSFVDVIVAICKGPDRIYIYI